MLAPDRVVYGQAKLTIEAFDALGASTGTRTVTARPSAGIEWPNAHGSGLTLPITVTNETTGSAPPGGAWVFALVEDDADVGGNFTTSAGTVALAPRVLAIQSVANIASSAAQFTFSFGDNSGGAAGDSPAVDPPLRKGGTFRLVMSAGSTAGSAAYLNNVPANPTAENSTYHYDSDGNDRNGPAAVAQPVAGSREVGVFGVRLVWNASAPAGGTGPDGAFRYRDIMTLSGVLKPASDPDGTLVSPKQIKLGLSIDAEGLSRPDGIYRADPAADGSYSVGGILVDTDFGEFPGGLQLFQQVGVNDIFGDIVTPAGERAGIYGIGAPVIGVTEAQKAWAVLTNTVLTPPKPQILLAMSGNQRADGFDLSIILDQAASDVVLLLSRNADMSDATPISLGPTTRKDLDTGARAHVVKAINIAGLESWTRYYWRVVADGYQIPGYTGEALTNVAPGTPKTFSAIFTSCQRSAAADTSFNRIAAFNPAIVFQMGDWHYYYGFQNRGLPAHRRAFIQTGKRTGIRNMLRKCALAYMHDNHDSGDPVNNSLTFSPSSGVPFSVSMANAIDCYRELLPHCPVAQPEGTGWKRGVGQAITIGRVRFLMPDLRYQRSYKSGLPPTLLGDGQPREMPVWDQKQWVKDQYLQAGVDGIRQVVLVSTTQWLELNGGGGSWSLTAPGEKLELQQFFRDNKGPEVLVVCGDAHYSGMDDGTTQGADIGANIPSIMSSPVDQAADPTGSAIHSWDGTVRERAGFERQFVSIVFIDKDTVPQTASDRIQWNARILGGAEEDDDPLGRVFNFDRTSTVGFRDAGAVEHSIAAGDFQAVIDRTWFGQCSVGYQVTGGTAVPGQDFTAVPSGTPFELGAHNNAPVIPVRILPGATPGRTILVRFTAAGTAGCSQVSGQTQITITLTP